MPTSRPRAELRVEMGLGLFRSCGLGVLGFCGLGLRVLTIEFKGFAGFWVF